MELYLLPFFVLPLIFLIRRIIKGNLSKSEWALYYIPIIAAIVSFYLTLSPQFEKDYNFFLTFIILAIIFFVAPIGVEIIKKFLSSKSVVQQFKNSSINRAKIQEFSYRQQLDLEEYLDTAK